MDCNWMLWRFRKQSDLESVSEKYPQCRDYPLITSSDAHYLEKMSGLRLPWREWPNPVLQNSERLWQAGGQKDQWN